MGGADDSNPGDDRRMAQGPGSVAVSRPYLLVRGHYAADARGRSDVPGGRQPLETDHEEHRSTAARMIRCRFLE